MCVSFRLCVGLKEVALCKRSLVPFSNYRRCPCLLLQLMYLIPLQLINQMHNEFQPVSWQRMKKVFKNSLRCHIHRNFWTLWFMKISKSIAIFINKFSKIQMVFFKYVKQVNIKSQQRLVKFCESRKVANDTTDHRQLSHNIVNFANLTGTLELFAVWPTF